MHKARLWIVNDGRYSWIHPGGASAQWWVCGTWTHNLSSRSKEAAKSDGIARYLDPDAHAKVHQLMREKYSVADMWVRFLEGTDTRSGLLTWGKNCKTVRIRIEPIPAAPWS